MWILKKKTSPAQRSCLDRGKTAAKVQNMGVSPGFHHRNPRGSPVPLRRSSLPSGRRSQGLLRGHARQELPNFPQQFCSAEAWWYPNRKIQKAHDFKGFKGMFNDLWWFLCFCPGFKGKHLVVSYNALWYIYIYWFYDYKSKFLDSDLPYREDSQGMRRYHMMISCGFLHRFPRSIPISMLVCPRVSMMQASFPSNKWEYP